MTLEHTCPVCDLVSLPDPDGRHTCPNLGHAPCSWWTYQPDPLRPYVLLGLCAASIAITALALVTLHWVWLLVIVLFYALLLSAHTRHDRLAPGDPAIARR